MSIPSFIRKNLNKLSFSTCSTCLLNMESLFHNYFFETRSRFYEDVGTPCGLTKAYTMGTLKFRAKVFWGLQTTSMHSWISVCHSAFFSCCEENLRFTYGWSPRLAFQPYCLVTRATLLHQSIALARKQRCFVSITLHVTKMEIHVLSARRKKRLCVLQTNWIQITGRSPDMNFWTQREVFANVKRPWQIG